MAVGGSVGTVGVLLLLKLDMWFYWENGSENDGLALLDSGSSYSFLGQ